LPSRSHARPRGPASPGGYAREPVPGEATRESQAPYEIDRRVFGELDRNLRRIERALPVRILTRGGTVRVTGEPQAQEAAEAVLRHLRAMAARGEPVGEQEVDLAIRAVKQGRLEEPGAGDEDSILVTARGKTIRPKTAGQRAYVEAMRRSAIVFGIGPAGTGKTYLAMAMAVAALRRKEVARIVLCRPAVEAGEKLGFLPGDLQEKVDPYLRPLYDALFDMLGVETYERYRERGIVEVAPLAYMRGRTLDDAFIILDEAQNTTPEQMKMLLTRLGFGSRAVVTGDVTQIDLPRGQYSGLREAMEILRDVSGIEFCYLTDADVVRHELVARIIQAYEAYEKRRRQE
jgi:phosphate starvation-inducible PhoH-like protein